MYISNRAIVNRSAIRSIPYLDKEELYIPFKPLLA